MASGKGHHKYARFVCIFSEKLSTISIMSESSHINGDDTCQTGNFYHQVIKSAKTICATLTYERIIAFNEKLPRNLSCASRLIALCTKIE